MFQHELMCEFNLASLCLECSVNFIIIKKWSTQSPVHEGGSLLCREDDSNPV